MSSSYKALAPAITMVQVPTHRIKSFIGLRAIKSLNRNSRYTPAVTRVEEWTKDDTGVGAAIAAGNQAEKGIWALLVIAARVIATAVKLSAALLRSFDQTITFHLPKVNLKAIANRIRTSPTRLVRAVRSPALYDLVL